VNSYQFTSRSRFLCFKVVSTVYVKNGSPKPPDHGVMCFYGGKGLSEKGKINIEIRQIFKIPNSGVNKFTIQKKWQNTIVKNLIPS
jgi:hypothetical protein